ncbi:glycosyltransferase family 2 protein [Halostagnicola kamekurae]|uniref:Glycosyl transferase family 2 n=1 Tax=Halostagnicola kamekurae TaxID=619731 RepID=A0A1I6QLQ7_9EURY|nr:glycosyltransferase family 2 protein [Halostagnicola kamekurae]SFS53401.1 Glycosyl transferase family 2 [Halostagnicola kamekurae]
MYREATVGVVLPAYNEEGFVGDVIREIPEYVDRIYAIDDQSTDGTWEEILAAARAESGAQTGAISSTVVDGDHSRGGDDQPHAADDHSRAAANQPGTEDDQPRADGGPEPLTTRATLHDSIGRVLPIQHRENMGAGGAIKTGYLAALEEGVTVTATIDADGQMDLSQLPRLLDPIVEGRADYAKGNRLLDREYRAAMPRFRFVGNSMLTFLTKVASGYWKTMDPQNGYTAISHEALEAVDVPSLYEYYGYCNDLLVKLNVDEMRVADVGMPAVYGDEESSIEYSTYIPNVSLMLLRDFLWRLKTKHLVTDFHPLALFYLFGAGTTALGVVAACLTVVDAVGQNGPVLASGITSALVCCLGVSLLLFAMVFDMAESEQLEQQFPQ